MITIEFNGRKMSVSASEERVLRILRYENWAAKKAEFVEGSTPRHQNTILPKSNRRKEELGIYVSENLWEKHSTLGRQGIIATNDKVPFQRRLDFFKASPRCHSGIFGNPRRINAILNKIDALDAEKIEHKLSLKRQDEAKLQKLELFLAGLE